MSNIFVCAMFKILQQNLQTKMSQIKKQDSYKLTTSVITPQPHNLTKNLSSHSQSKQASNGSTLNNEILRQNSLRNSQKQASFAQRQIIEDKQTSNDNKNKQQIDGSQKQVPNKGQKSPKTSNAQKISAEQTSAQKVTNNESNIKRRIPLTKDDIRELQKVDKYRLLKIKNGEIKDKIGNLREELYHQYYEKKASFKLPDHQFIKMNDYFSLDHPKTEQASIFVSKMQNQKKEEKMRYRQYEERQQKQKEFKKSIEIQQKMLEREEKRRRMQQLYNQKKMRKKIQQEENERKKQEIKHWAKMFNKQKPLYIRKEEEFIENELIPQIYNRREKLYEIKMQRRELNLDEIKEHEERYLQYKKDNTIRHEAEVQIEKQKQKKYSEEVSQYYKGRYRLLALEEMMNQKMKINQDPRDIERIKKARQIVYGDQTSSKIREEIKIRQLKTLELPPKKQFVKRTRGIDGSVSIDNDSTKVSSFSDPRADGQKNFNFLKQLVRQKGVKKYQPMIKLVEQRNVYPNYLNDIKQKRRNSLHLANSSDKSSKDSSLTDIKSLIATERKLTDKIRRNEQRRKYMSLDSKQQARFQDNQIQAVKLKLKLMNELK